MQSRLRCWFQKDVASRGERQQWRDKVKLEESVDGGNAGRESQVGGERACVVPRVVFGRRGVSMVSRCSKKVTWKELNILLVEVSHNR